MRTERAGAERDHIAVLAQIGGCFGGGLLASVWTLDGCAPLAAGLMAALPPGRSSVAALAGASVGAAVFLGFGEFLRCCGILTLIAAALSAFRDTPWIRAPWFRPLTAGLCTMAVEGICLMELGASGAGAARLLGYAATSAALGHYFSLLCGECILPKREKREAEKLRDRLRRGAQAIRSLGESLGSCGEVGEEDPSVVFDRASEVVCRGCALRELCWSREYISTFNAFNDATPAIMARGRAESGDFPLHFSARCIHFPQLLAAVNTEVSALLLRRQYRRRLEAERRRVRGQYEQLSELVVQTLAAPEREQDGREVPFDVAMGTEAKAGQRLCGDSVTYFRGGGKLFLLLCDGMGSGREAQRESRLALRLMEQFLTAGVDPACALRTLNAALNIRCDTRGSFTTIDLLCVDPCTLAAQLFKYGAAPTYIKKNAMVRRLTGSALPAGLEEPGNSVSPISFMLEENSFVLMVSDGVADSSDDKWVMDLMAGWQGDDPHGLAAAVMRECGIRRKREDDCSVLCFCVSGRKGREV